MSQNLVQHHGEPSVWEPPTTEGPSIASAAAR